MPLIELKDALHAVDIVTADEGIKRKGKAIKKRLKALPVVEVGKDGKEVMTIDKISIDGHTGIYDGIVRIIWENKAKEIILTATGTENDEMITLDDCLDVIGHDGNGICIVIFDNATHGKIYQYGNYGEYWTEYGETQGYA